MNKNEHFEIERLPTWSSYIPILLTFYEFLYDFNRSISISREEHLFLCVIIVRIIIIFSLFLYQFCYMIESICLIAYNLFADVFVQWNALTERYKKKFELFQCFLLFDEKKQTHLIDLNIFLFCFDFFFVIGCNKYIWWAKREKKTS